MLRVKEKNDIKSKYSSKNKKINIYTVVELKWLCYVRGNKRLFSTKRKRT